MKRVDIAYLSRSARTERDEAREEERLTERSANGEGEGSRWTGWRAIERIQRSFGVVNHDCV